MPVRSTPDDDPFAHPALDDALRALARRGTLRRYPAGTLMIQEGDTGDSLYVILRGRLRAFSVDFDSGREFVYGTYGPGEYVGEMSLDGGPRSACVDAVEDTRCAVVTRAALLQHIAEQPDFALTLLAKVIARARAATLSARQLALNDVYGRVRAWLESHAGPPGPDGTRRIAGRTSGAALAGQLGCTARMVNRILSDLERGGFVERQPDGLRVRRALPARW